MNIVIYQDHTFLTQISKKSDEPLCVCRVPSKTHTTELAVCGGGQWLVREGQPKWCAEERKYGRPKQLLKKRFMGRGLIPDRR